MQYNTIKNINISGSMTKKTSGRDDWFNGKYTHRMRECAIELTLLNPQNDVLRCVEKLKCQQLKKSQFDFLDGNFRFFKLFPIIKSIGMFTNSHMIRKTVS